MDPHLHAPDSPEHLIITGEKALTGGDFSTGEMGSVQRPKSRRR